MDGGLFLKIDRAKFEKTFSQIISYQENPQAGYRAVGAID